LIKILTIIGARPQIIKAAGLSRAIKTNFSKDIVEIIVHTGQHYDANMSQVFFDELGIPMPNYNLNVGSGSHGVQTSKMIEGIEEILVKEQPSALVVFGDTNSTLAAAVAASKIHIPIVHIEAGLRSYNKSMPEEVNRIMCDHVSTILFSPTKSGLDNLLKEGFSSSNSSPYTIDNPAVFHCGDIMYDNSLYFAKVADEKSTILSDHNIEKNNYVLSTIHRNDNTDTPERLSQIFESILHIINENDIDFVLPLHPRTKKLLEINTNKNLFERINTEARLKIIPPVSFLEMIALEKNAAIIVTDSGGVQKEAFFFQKPCVILRPETEWVELVSCGAAKIVGWQKSQIIDAFNHFYKNENIEYPSLFGDGKSGNFMCQKMIDILN